MATIMEARTIMAPHFVGPADAKLTLKLTEHSRSPRIPYAAETLVSHSKTHILTWVPPLTLSELYDLAPNAVRLFHDQEPIFPIVTRLRMSTRWMLIRKEPIAGSLNKCWRDCIAMLPPGESALHACELAYSFLVYFLLTGEVLFKDTYALSKDQAGYCGVMVRGCYGGSVDVNIPDVLGTIYPTAMATALGP